MINLATAQHNLQGKFPWQKLHWAIGEQSGGLEGRTARTEEMLGGCLWVMMMANHTITLTLLLGGDIPKESTRSEAGGLGAHCCWCTFRSS